MKSKPFLMRQMEKKTSSLRTYFSKPEKGWVREIREALGMTLAKLGERCELATSTIAQVERREVSGNVTVESLRKTAEAMNCEFVYMFVPKTSMEEFVRERAKQKAQSILERAGLHMSLENQEVKGGRSERLLRLQEKLIAEGKVW